LLGSDDIVDVPASVDDGTKVTRGGVVEVTAPCWFVSTAAVPALGALSIDGPTAFLLDVICVCCLDVG
jgi:hypothetical protein